MTRQKIIDLLAMSRFANLPTVWSNGLFGLLIGLSLDRFETPISPFSLTCIAIALSALYLGGCFFNDWHDFEFDKKTRPDRPIPSGRWKRTTILSLAVGLMGLGVVLPFLVTVASGICAVGIVICILAYTKWHKINPISFFFMAGARALIYPLAALSVISWDHFQNHAGLFVLLGLGLGGYILGISLTARAETSKTAKEDTEKIFPILCLVSPAILFSGPLLASGNQLASIPLVIFIIVLATIVRLLRSTHQVGQFVSRTLAAIPLVDFLMLFVLAPNLATLVLCPVFAFMALGLQKIAPAT